jgi:hypothetical protein
VTEVRLAALIDTARSFAGYRLLGSSVPWILVDHWTLVRSDSLQSLLLPIRRY